MIEFDFDINASYLTTRFDVIYIYIYIYIYLYVKPWLKPYFVALISNSC